MLACFPCLLSSVCYVTQGHLPSGSQAYDGPESPTSITEQEIVLLACPQANLMEAVLQLRFPLPSDLSLCQFDKSNQYTTASPDVVATFNIKGKAIGLLVLLLTLEKTFMKTFLICVRTCPSIPQSSSLIRGRACKDRHCSQQGP